MGDTRVVSCSLSSFCPHALLCEEIRKNVLRVNRLSADAYALVNIDVRRRFEMGNTLPPDFLTNIRQYFMAVSRASRNGPPSFTSPDVLFTAERANLLAKHDRKNLTNALTYAAEQLKTAIENNIQVHYFKRQRRVLRLKHPNLDYAAISALADAENAPLAVPSGNVAYELKRSPEKFLPIMFGWLKYIEERRATWTAADGRKMPKTFALLPVKRSYIPGFVQIGTDVLNDWVTGFEESKVYRDAKKQRLKETKGQGKKRKRNKCEVEEALESQEKDLLWEPFFKLSKVTNRKTQFAYHIATDGISVRATVIRPSKAENVPSKRACKKGKNHRKFPSTFSPTIVGIDPGKKDLVHATSDSGERQKSVRYTQARRTFESGAVRFAHKQNKLGTREAAEEELSRLAAHDSYTSSAGLFSSYWQAHKAAGIRGCMDHFENDLFRIHRWWSQGNRKRSEARFVNEMKEKFGKGAILAYGNWDPGPSQMRGCEPTPNRGIKKLLSKTFRIVEVPEYRTTKTCYKCGEEVGSAVKHLNEKTGEQRDCRGLRRCKNENCAVYWTRDYNAALNIRANYMHYVEHGTWHPRFVRQ